MKKASKAKLNIIIKEYSSATKLEIWENTRDNFIYGFLGAILVVFISRRIDLGVFLGYFIYNSFLSKIINRPKYVTELGKRIIFPIPTTIGAFSGYKLTGIILEYIK
jgi:hypothetical protein